MLFGIRFKESNRKPKQLFVDKGKEFYNSHVKPLFERIYSVQNEGKSPVIERFNNKVDVRIITDDECVKN